MTNPTPEQMNCGRCLYGSPALCTCGTCPKEYFDRWMPADGWPEEWIADGPPENIHILVADKPHMRVCFMTSDGPTEERASLIAQAPSLRAALKEMVNAWEPDAGGSDHAIWEWAKDILSRIECETVPVQKSGLDTAEHGGGGADPIQREAAAPTNSPLT